MYCSKCGTQQADDTVFCSACGQPTGAAPRSPMATVVPAGVPVATGYGNPGYVPAQVTIAVPSPYAGFWLRLLAYIIDNVVLGVIFGVIVLLVVAAVGVGYFRTMFQGMQDGTGEFPVALIAAVLVGVLLTLIASWIYHAWMDSSEYQATLGKMALGLIVTDLNDRPISFARASGRFFAKIITGLIPFGIGYIMAGFTEKKQALHDMIASCLVLKKR
jgi:uncharacterized RDD family membrane protein YckC